MVAAIVLPFAGLAWISVLRSLNAGAQSLLPGWARARGLSYYQLIFMGGQAFGRRGVGGVADSLRPEDDVRRGGGRPLRGGLGARRFPLRMFDVDLTPSRHWPEPHVVIDAEPDAGPVLVTVEYRVPEGNAGAFRAAMAPVGRSRRRTGAFRWGLYQDAADPTRFVETYEVATWGEHLRQHEERLTVRDEEFEARARSLTDETSEPSVSRLFASAPTVAETHRPVVLCNYPRRSAMDVLERPVGHIPAGPPFAPPAELDEAAARRTLRVQIGRLEAELGAVACSAYPRSTLTPSRRATAARACSSSVISSACATSSRRASPTCRAMLLPPGRRARVQAPAD